MHAVLTTHSHARHFELIISQRRNLQMVQEDPHACLPGYGSKTAHEGPYTCQCMHLQEKLDHFGIVALVVGTPVTALMAHEHGEIPFDVKLCFALMLVAALCPPAARVAGFSGGTIAMVALHWRVIFNANLGVQLCLYGLSAVCFLRCQEQLPAVHVLVNSHAGMLPCCNRACVLWRWPGDMRLPKNSSVGKLAAYERLKCMHACMHSGRSFGSPRSGRRACTTTTCCTTLSLWPACCTWRTLGQPRSVQSRLPLFDLVHCST